MGQLCTEEYVSLAIPCYSWLSALFRSRSNLVLQMSIT